MSKIPRTVYHKGEHGFYLPTIKVWNMFAEAIREIMKESFILKGSIEDYIFDGGNGTCDHCKSDMKRVLLETNHYFNGASIFCTNFNSLDHPQEYWIEAWPDASSKLSNKEYHNKSEEEKKAYRFRLSNPIIKSCWDGRMDEFSMHSYAIAQEDFPGYDNSALLPKEEYNHGNK